MRHFILILTVLTVTTCTTKKGIDFCGTLLLSEKGSLDSKITDVKTIGIADTTVAFLSGQVLGNWTHNDTTRIDTLIHAVAVGYKHQIDTSRHGTLTELDGQYSLTLSAGTYDISINHIGFNTIIIRNLTLGTGEIKELSVTLGEGRGMTEYLMTNSSQYKRLTEKKNQQPAHNKTNK